MDGKEDYPGWGKFSEKLWATKLLTDANLLLKFLKFSEDAKYSFSLSSLRFIFAFLSL
jgi:hypothetical protein